MFTSSRRRRCSVGDRRLLANASPEGLFLTMIFFYMYFLYTILQRREHGPGTSIIHLPTIRKLSEFFPNYSKCLKSLTQGVSSPNLTLLGPPLLGISCARVTGRSFKLLWTFCSKRRKDRRPNRFPQLDTTRATPQLSKSKRR